MATRKNKISSQEKKKEYQKQYHKNYDKHRVNLALSKTEYASFCEVAEKEGLKVATVVRNMALAFLQSRPYVNMELEEKLKEHNFLVRNIANNINQIAHRVNMGQVVDVHEVLAYIKQLDALVKAYTSSKVEP